MHKLAAHIKGCYQLYRIPTTAFFFKWTNKDIIKGVHNIWNI